MRFSIRDLLWLTVVVAFAVLWWGEYRQRMTDSAELRAELKRVQQERDSAISRERATLKLFPDGLKALRELLEQTTSQRRQRETLNNN